MEIVIKNLYIIGETMGVGKRAVSQQLKKDLPNSVFLDGDWCWDASPFQVNEETKAMVLDNICCILNNFLHCSVYENIIFCWVMHEQAILDTILARLDTESCCVKCISLVADESTLRKRLTGDIDKGLRSPDVIDRSIARLPMYRMLNTVRINTSGKSVQVIADEISAIENSAAECISRG